MTIEHKRRAAKVLAKQTAKTRKRIKDGLATVDVGERADVDIPELPKLPDLSGQFDTPFGSCSRIPSASWSSPPKPSKP